MSITYPWFLLSLVTLGVPVLIHLFELRRPQRLAFTNVGFIREVKLISAKQRKLKHIIVLLARIGGLFFLILAFAQPFIPASKEQKTTGSAIAVLIDNSPSMQARGNNEQSVFDNAVEQAQGLSNAFVNNTSFLLQEGPKSILNASAYQAALKQLTISGQARSLKSSIAQTNFSRSRIAQTFIISDFQKNAFSPQFLRGVDSTKDVSLVPIASQEAANVYVDSIALDDAFVRSGNNISLKIRVRNGGNAPAKDVQVKLFIAEQQAAVYRATIEAGKTSTSVVQVRLTENGLRKCRVEVEDFPVTFDNTYYFTLQPSPQIKVLGIGNNTAALEQLYGNEPLFAFTASQPQSTNYRSLAAANLVVLQELPRVDATLRESLTRALQQGTSIVIVPPAGAVGHDTYNQLFRELGIGVVQWEERSSGDPELQEIATPSPQNPFFKDVFAAQNRQPIMPKAAPILRWSRSGSDVLQMRDGSGYLAGFSNGQAAVYLFSAPFNTTYSDFTSHALFVPVMYRLAMQSYRSDQQIAYRLNQRAVAFTLPQSVLQKADQVFKLTKDSLSFIPAQRIQAGVLRFDVPSGMTEPGFYALEQNGKKMATLAFNFDKHESELAQYSADDLRKMIGPDQPNIHVYDPAKGGSVASQYRAERVGKPLWRYCLWISLAFLLLEVLALRAKPKVQASRPAVAA
ncbi:BatA domain-containing protein [Hymenobacter sp. BT491]|uniref:BatA domain-containing protein n=1 Tax=Hymenobacter sp. BT491 TaxID=2766779 RepID=UPI0021CD0222|nr:BatA domain-containing protein [Hymenobacter sp. BT491]